MLLFAWIVLACVAGPLVGRCIALNNQEEDDMTRPRASGPFANSVEVVRADYSRTTYARCTVDEFEADTLTVTSIDDERVMDIHRPGTWRTASAFGADGYPLFAFASRMEAERKPR